MIIRRLFSLREDSFSEIPYGGVQGGLISSGISKNKHENTIRMQKDLGFFGPDGNQLFYGAKRSMIFNGDFAASSNKNNLKAYKYLIKNDRLQDFRNNFGKKGYRIKDIKKEMKQNGSW